MNVERGKMSEFDKDDKKSTMTQLLLDNQHRSKMALAQHLTDTRETVVGCVGLFSGTFPEVANGDER